jgi:hypothetical protein
MKIAIDVDGTALERPEFFIAFMKGMQSSGHKVGFLTSRNTNLDYSTLEELDECGFPPPDFYISKTDAEKTYFKSLPENNGYWKAAMVKAHKIDYLFDDFDSGNLLYIEAFKRECPNTLFLL